MKKEDNSCCVSIMTIFVDSFVGYDGCGGGAMLLLQQRRRQPAGASTYYLDI